MLRPQMFRCFGRLRCLPVDGPQTLDEIRVAQAALNAYWRAIALPYEESLLQLGVELVHKNTSFVYHRLEGNGDALDIGVRCTEISDSLLRFEIGIFCFSALVASAELRYELIASATHAPIPQTLRALIADFEAGREVSELRSGDWNSLGRDALRLRMQVFVREQHIDAALEVDGRDEAARHVVVYNGLGLPVATGRLITQSAGVGRIGRLAVARNLRGSGLGRQVLDALLAAAKARGDQQVLLHAQRSAEDFYRRAGFTSQGEPYDEAGIEHITMLRKFS